VFSPVHQVVAGGPVAARRAGALVHVDLAVLAVEPGLAVTGVGGDQVAAGGPVEAGARLTLIDLGLTVHSWRERRRSVTVMMMMMMMMRIVMKARSCGHMLCCLHHQHLYRPALVSRYPR